MATLGIIFAIGALVFWTIGDFSIEKATRKIGDWETLFYIGAFGFIFITPFVWNEIIEVFSTDASEVILLLLLSVITLFSALFLFEALKKGKLSIIEPVFGLELPITIAFSIVLGGEQLPLFVYILCAVVFLGLLLTVTTHHTHLHIHKTVLEKGVVLAGIGSIGMGLMNFLTGVGSNTSSPLFTIWFVHSFLAIICLAYIISKGRGTKLRLNLKTYFAPAFSMATFDNLGWISYAYSMTLIPISIATTISEAYIAPVVLLGIYFNREKIKWHQVVGIIITIGGVLMIAYNT